MAEPVVVAVIQARMGSSRLPGKVLMPLAGAPLLQRLVERVRRSERLDRVVVATSTQPENDAIADLCRDMGCACHRGSETDVLDRMLAAAGDATVMVRLTADNPFVDGQLVDEVISAFLRVPGTAYASTTGESGFPYGLFVEVAAMAALREAVGSTDPMDREHVTWYLRQRPERFPAVTVAAAGRFGERSVTIDTPEDYARLAPLFARLYAADPRFPYTALMV